MGEISRDFFTLSPAPSAILGAAGEFRAVNPAWRRVLGLGVATSLPPTHLALVHPEDREFVQAALERVTSGFVARYRHAQGGWKGLEVYSRRTPNGDAYLSGREVSAPAGIPLTEQTFEQILDAVSEMVLVKGPGSRILWANRAFRELYGMSNEELQNQIDGPFSPRDLTERYVRDDAQVFETGQRLEIREEPVTRHDGESRYVMTSKIPLFDPSGRVKALVALIRDITEQKTTQALLDEQRQKMLATAKMSALGEMASGIAHEINNPLAVINLRAAQMREWASQGPVSSELVIRNADKIEAVALRISKIIRGLRAFARDGALDPPQPSPLASLIDDTLEMSAERFRREQVELQVERAPGSAGLQVECRPVQVSQVILNLLNNALDAVGTLEQAERRWVKLTVGRRERWAELTIEDGGPGIPTEVVGKIFQPFFTTKGAGKGTGLGLSVSKGIVEAHGGTLEVDSSKAHTCFRVRLPLYPPVGTR